MIYGPEVRSGAELHLVWFQVDGDATPTVNKDIFEVVGTTVTAAGTGDYTIPLDDIYDVVTGWVSVGKTNCHGNFVGATTATGVTTVNFETFEAGSLAHTNSVVTVFLLVKVN